MPDGVQFEEEGSEISIPVRAGRSSNVAASMGFGRNPAQANVVLILFAAGLICGSFYMLTSALPKPPPPLGSDALRSHESVGPNYAK